MSPFSPDYKPQVIIKDPQRAQMPKTAGLQPIKRQRNSIVIISRTQSQIDNANRQAIMRGGI